MNIRPAKLTQQDHVSDEWAEELIRERLPRLRSLGEKWSGTIGRLTGLLGAGTLLQSDTVVRALDTPWNFAYGVLAGGALAAAAAATLLAGAVAQGGVVDVEADVDKRRGLEPRLVDQAIRRLRLSRLATAAAVALLLGSLAVRWYAPT